MSYQSDLYTAITGDNGIAAVIGTRVFADVADMSAVAPYVVYSTIYTGGETTHDGVRNLEFPMIQLACWAATKAAAVAIGDAIMSLLDGNTIAGASNLTLTFSGRSGFYDAEERLFGEFIELTGASKR